MFIRVRRPNPRLDRMQSQEQIRAACEGQRVAEYPLLALSPLLVLLCDENWAGPGANFGFRKTSTHRSRRKLEDSF